MSFNVFKGFDAVPRKPPPSPEPAPPTRAPYPWELSSQLLAAIAARDIDAAQQVFDAAFWNKVSFKPDSYHLLKAAETGERKLVALLTAYGATWTAEETRVARGTVGAEEWKKITSTLKSAGIDTVQHFNDVAAPAHMTRLRWAKRALTEAKYAQTKDKPKDLSSLERHLHSVARDALIHYVAAGDMQRARIVLPYRNAKKGAGTEADPFDFADEFSQLMDTDILGRGSRALAFLDAFLEAGYKIKPIEVTSVHLILARNIILDLDSRCLLDRGSRAARAEILQEWTRLEQVIDFGGHIFDIGEVEYARQDAGLKSAAAALFSKGHEATAQEAEDFIRIHNDRLKTNPAALKHAERGLLETGFFDSPAWTPQRLSQLAQTLPENDALRAAFNAHAARKRSADNSQKPQADDIPCRPYRKPPKP